MNNTSLWAELLKQAPKSSVLMGGAIVDSVLGMVPKDYDIFHPYQPGMPKVPDNWTFIVPPDGEVHNAEYDIPNKQGIKCIGSVYNYNVLIPGQLLKVQLIGVHHNDPKQYFKDFDHTLTLGMYTKAGVFIHQKVFDSINNKTVTLLNPMRPEKSLMRAKKKIAKYDPMGYDDWSYIGW